MNELEERYDLYAASALIFGHARSIGVHPLSKVFFGKRAGGSTIEEQRMIVAAGKEASLKVLGPFRYITGNQREHQIQDAVSLGLDPEKNCAETDLSGRRSANAWTFRKPTGLTSPSFPTGWRCLWNRYLSNILCGRRGTIMGLIVAMAQSIPSVSRRSDRLERDRAAVSRLLKGCRDQGKSARPAHDFPGYIQKELRVSPTGSQGAAVQAAQERARECLRRKHPFVWNAANLTKDTRRKLIGLFERYGAKVRIVYLETDQ